LVGEREKVKRYKLIRQTEQALNGFMAHVRRQKAGAQEYGDKKLREDGAAYDIPFEETGNNTE